LKSVDLPTFGRPTMPHLMPIFLQSKAAEALSTNVRQKAWLLPD
jgi:hypothetical protein